MDRGVEVLLDQLLRIEDGVLEVVSAPRHERNQDVAAERQLANLGRRPVAEHLAGPHALANADDRFLVDASVLVGTLELDELVDIRANLARHLPLVQASVDADDDALGVHRVDDAVATADHDGARVTGGDALHTGANDGRVGAQQRHGLPLHVRPHQRAVGVIVLEERDEAGCNRDELLGADVEILDLGLLLELEVAGHAAVGELRDDPAVVGDRNVRLGDGVEILRPKPKGSGSAPRTGPASFSSRARR